MTKRLFLFAGYAPNGINESLLVYLRELSKLGDVLLVMDSDTDVSSALPYTIYAKSARHSEYDFGSYKRGWEHVTSNQLPVTSYDFIYLVNDSVYVTGEIKPAILKMESSGADAAGMVWREHKSRPHIQSWFIGMRPTVFNSKWFDEFLRGVKHHDDKGSVARIYEHGFTNKLTQNNLSYYCVWTVHGREIYNVVKKLWGRGFPFIKKLSFRRHNGCLGMQLNYVMRRIRPEFRNAILSDIDTNVLTNNPIKILMRKIKYAWGKIWQKK